jgi:hypothetical protein
MEIGEGHDARGIFRSTASAGRAFRFARNRNRLGSIDRFAELLSEHNLETGDVGGDVAECARKMGLKPGSGNGMLHRIRKQLGPQAR